MKPTLAIALLAACASLSACGKLQAPAPLDPHWLEGEAEPIAPQSKQAPQGPLTHKPDAWRGPNRGTSE